MKKLLLFLLVITLCWSCGDDMEENMNPVLVDCTYLKARIGTSFKNVFSDNSTFTAIVFGTQQRDGNQYVVLVDEVGNTTFINCEGDKFILTAKEVTALNSDVTIRDVKMEFDLSSAVGQDSLLQTITNSTTIAEETSIQRIDYYGKVVARDLTKVVLGKEYTDVVEYSVRTVEVEDNGPSIETTNTTYHFAPEVSAISTESIRSIDNSLIFRTELLEYIY